MQLTQHTDFGLRLLIRLTRSGGVELARSPEDIRIGEVVRLLERGLQLADCGTCALRYDCGTSGLLAEALAAFMAVLDRTTLAEAARPGKPAFPPWAGEPTPG
jgi:Rrf2 family nitric oxide-sensitive transcriptional repressor